MALQLLCARPLFRQLDIESARFVVSKWCGLTANGQELQYGDEVPQGSLTRYALECVYDRPLARIEELNYALTLDGLRQAVESRGIKPTPPQQVMPDLEVLDREGMARLCELYGLSAKGNLRVLRQRLEEHLK
jgi:hypothetical protein